MCITKTVCENLLPKCCKLYCKNNFLRLYIQIFYLCYIFLNVIIRVYVHFYTTEIIVPIHNHMKFTRSLDEIYARNLARIVKEKFRRCVTDFWLWFQILFKFKEIRNNYSIWNMVKKQTINPIEFEVDLWRNSSIKFHIFYNWINMIEISMLFLTKILLEFYNKNLNDVWYIYLKYCRLKIQHEFYRGYN